MKYLAPKFELVIISSNDVLTASGDKYEIESEGTGKGKVIFSASDLFSE